MPVGKPLHLRLFLEGHEVPVISASVNIGVNAPSACAVQLVPLDELMELKPRTMVHLFYLDSKVARNLDGSLSGGLTDSYRLLFAGETIGFSTVLTPQSRAIILQCVDFSSYWDSAHASAISYGPGGNAFNANGPGGMAGGDSAGLFDDIVDQQQNVVLEWLRSKPKTPGLETVSGLAGGIIRMMEAMGGVIPHHKGVNDFFTVAELRCRLLHQITAEEGDNTAARVMGGQVFDQWLKNSLQNIGQQVTFRDMMLMLMKYIYYDFVPCPVAKFEDGSAGKTAVKTQKIFADSAAGSRVRDLLFQAQSEADRTRNADVGMTEDERLSRLRHGDDLNALKVSTAKRVISLVGSAQDVLKTVGGNPPEFLTLARQIDSYCLKARIAAQAILKDSPGDPDSQSSKNPLTPVLDNLYEALLLMGTQPNKIFVTIKTAQAQRLHTMIVRPDCWFAPPPVCNVIFPEQFSQVSYDRNYMGETTRLYLGVFTSLVGVDPILARHTIIAPNNGFDVKALLKISHLEQYRTLLDHEIHTGILPKSEWVSDTMSGGTKASAADAVTAKGVRLDWANRIALFHFFKYRFATRQMQVAGRFNPGVVCGFPGAVIRRPYIIRGGEAALEQLMKDSTDKSSQSIFNYIHENGKELGAPVHFIGMIVNVQHSISQDGGNTMVQMSHARTHSGTDDDFIQIFLKQKEGKVTRLVKTTYNFEEVKSDPVLLKFLGSVTPQVTVSASATKVSQKTLAATFLTQSKKSANPNEPANTTKDSSFMRVEESTSKQGPLPALVVKGKIEKAGLTDVLVPSPEGRVGVGEKGRFGTIVGIEVLENGDFQDGAAVKSVFKKPTAKEKVDLGGGDVELRTKQTGEKSKTSTVYSSLRAFKSVTVYEEVSVTTESRIPVEQVMRPPWFSPKYDNRSIGEQIYRPFFGCDSIIDGINVSGVKTSFPSSIDSSGTTFSADKKVDEVIAELVSQEAEKISVSIEKSLDVLGYLYGQVKQQGLDVDEFIRQINDRPVATMTDILGNDNLDFDIVGKKATPKKILEDSELRVGFHSGAVHPTLVDAGELIGLTDDLQTGLSQINGTGVKGVLPGRYDVRPSKRQRVVAYLEAFNTSRGLRG